MAPLDRLRRPAYTGPDRCWPCTVLNVGVLAVAVVTLTLVEPLVAVAVGVLGAASIWLRGYLVPFTPSLAPRIAGLLPGERSGADGDEEGTPPRRRGG